MVNGVPVNLVVDGFMILINIVLLIVGLKIKLEVTELRAYMFENFLPRKEFDRRMRERRGLTSVK